jgi:metal-sulfur cluster biosynthetic enzyme
VSESSTPTPQPVPVEEAEIRDALRRVKDPELGLGIVDLGLVYEIETNQGDVHVQVTLTSPGCPAGGQIIDDARSAVQALEGVRSVDIELVWEPLWTPERIDPKVRALMGY